MRSIEARFNLIAKKNPYLSSYIVFSMTVRGQGFAKDSIARWFNKLVSKEDYTRKDKENLIYLMVSTS